MTSKNPQFIKLTRMTNRELFGDAVPVPLSLDEDLLFKEEFLYWRWSDCKPRLFESSH